MSIVEVNGQNFDEQVINSKGKVLVDFNAGWCGPCKMLKPVIEELAESDSNTKYVSIDIDNEYDLASKYQVASIPCLVLFEDGKEVRRSVGFIPKAKIVKFVEG